MSGNKNVAKILDPGAGVQKIVEDCITKNNISHIMPERCVVFGCSNTTDAAKGIYVYQIPFCGKIDPILVKRRKKWIDFIMRKRDKCTPTRSSVACSKHFTEDCF